MEYNLNEYKDVTKEESEKNSVIKKIKQNIKDNSKYIFGYLVVLVIAIVMIATHGIWKGAIFIGSNAEGILKDYISEYFSLVNIIIYMICQVVLFVLTIFPKNKLKFKWLYFLAISIALLCIPTHRIDFLGVQTTYSYSSTITYIISDIEHLIHREN